MRNLSVGGADVLRKAHLDGKNVHTPGSETVIAGDRLNLGNMTDVEQGAWASCQFGL